MRAEVFESSLIRKHVARAKANARSIICHAERIISGHALSDHKLTQDAADEDSMRKFVVVHTRTLTPLSRESIA